MNLDERIKQELGDEAEHLDQLLTQEQGIFSMLASAYKGSLGRWLVIVTIAALMVSALMLYAGYQFFFIEGDIAFKLQWGLTLLLATMVQIALKMWSFMEMNRQANLREVKRLELKIETLIDQISTEK